MYTHARAHTHTHTHTHSVTLVFYCNNGCTNVLRYTCISCPVKICNFLTEVFIPSHNVPDILKGHLLWVRAVVTQIMFRGVYHCLNTCVRVLTLKRTQQFLSILTDKIIIFKCDIPVVFYKFNMYSVQLAVKTQLIYCTVCTMYKNYVFRPIVAIFRFFV